MSWFAVDDRFHSHRKVLRLRTAHSEQYAAGVAIWTLSGSWACGQEVERFTGRVPVDVVESFGVTGWRDALDALVLVGLWSCDGEVVGFHDWDQWNGTGSREHRSKESTRVRQHAFRLKRCESGSHSKDCPTTDLDGAPRECPKRQPKTPRHSASRDAGSGRVGSGREKSSSTEGRGDNSNVIKWDDVAPSLRTPTSLGGAS